MLKNFKASKLYIIFALAWPTMLEQLMQTTVQYVDVAMVGALGTDATAAVGATTTVNWLVNGTVSALGIGLLSYISQALGAGENKKAARASAQAVLLTFIAGILFTALTLGVSKYVPVWMQVDKNIQDISGKYFFVIYSPMLFRCSSIILGTVLRSAGDTRTPMLVGVLSNVINIVLNFVCIYPTRTVSILGSNIEIFGLGWGVLGAGAASAISFVIGGIFMFVALFKNSVISPHRQSFLPDKEILKPCLRVAFPNMLQRFGTSLGYVMFASMVNSLGEISTAAHTVANTVESLFYIPGYGMQTAAATLAGNAYGAGDKEQIRKLSKAILILETVLMVISGSLLFIFAPQMVMLFTRDAQVIFLGTTVLRMVALSEPFFGVPIVIEGMLQGMGKTAMPLAANVATMWGVRILGTFICTQMLSLGLISVWACMIAHNLALFFVFVLYWKFKKFK